MTGRVSVEEPATTDDGALVARCQAGDESAFDELVGKHQGRAVNVAFQLLRNYEDAVEVAQDAFVSVHRNIGQFRADCAFTTWLHQIVVNLARNKHRWWHRRGRQTTVSLDDPDRPQMAAAGETPAVEAAQAELQGRLSAAMGRLPRRYREALVLRNVEQLSYEEIAVALGCSVGTVKSRIGRGREALRQAMAGEW